jgi:hypothetical protein
LVRHDAAEQGVLYPIIARIEGGAEFRREVLLQEQMLAAALAALLRRLFWRPGGRGTLRRICAFADLLDRHLAFEETSLVPILLALENDRERQMMGTWLNRVGPWTPTRPHPHGPQRLSGLLTIGVVLGIVDRIRDKVVGQESGTSHEAIKLTAPR